MQRVGFAVALAWSGIAVLAGCSSGKDKDAGGRADSAVRADSATATATATPRADSGASSAAPAASAGSINDDIRTAENAWRLAVTGGDTVELGRMTAPGFTMVGSTGPGSTVTRSLLMKQVSEGMLQADSSSVSDLTVTGGGDSASANLSFFWRVSRMGKPAKPETMHVTDTWVKRDGRWQLASRKERAAK